MTSPNKLQLLDFLGRWKGGKVVEGKSLRADHPVDYPMGCGASTARTMLEAGRDEALRAALRERDELKQRVAAADDALASRERELEALRSKESSLLDVAASDEGGSGSPLSSPDDGGAASPAPLSMSSVIELSDDYALTPGAAAMRARDDAPHRSGAPAEWSRRKQQPSVQRSMIQAPTPRGARRPRN